jgi:hypothetical protein
MLDRFVAAARRPLRGSSRSAAQGELASKQTAAGAAELLEH